MRGLLRRHRPCTRDAAGERARARTRGARTRHLTVARRGRDRRIRSRPVGCRIREGPRGRRADVPPASIRIPRIGVDSRLEKLGVDDPRQADRARRLRPGGLVCRRRRTAALSAPRSSQGTSTRRRRRRCSRAWAICAAGDEVVITRSDGITTDIPRHAGRRSPRSRRSRPTPVYSNVPAPELRLITCAGAFDSAVGHYTDNLIVFAALRGVIAAEAAGAGIRPVCWTGEREYPVIARPSSRGPLALPGRAPISRTGAAGERLSTFRRTVDPCRKAPMTFELPLWFEIGSLVVLTLILIADLLLDPQAPAHPLQRESTLWVVFYVTLALFFAGLIGCRAARSTPGSSSPAGSPSTASRSTTSSCSC